MTNSDHRLDFPFYHGTSTHYLSGFQVGRAPAEWPHMEAALTLLRDVWAALALYGKGPDVIVRQVLEQASGASNWRHGLLYVTPSRMSAVRYAGAGSSFGGELLTFCRQALITLDEIDPLRSARALDRAPLLSGFLKGGGEPLLIDIRDLTDDDLSPEREGDGLGELKDLAGWSDELREVLGQQINFSLKPGRGPVSAIYRVTVENPGDPLTPYALKELT